MLTATLDSSGLERSKTRLLGQMLEHIEKAVQRAGDEAVAKAKQGAWKDRTGQLRSEIVFRDARWSGRYFIGVLHAKMPYASYVNDGTQPHDIWPKATYRMKGPVREGQTRRATGKGPHEHIVGRGLALRWKDAGGEQHFARMVKHPGTQPIPFMDQAADRARVVLYAELKSGFVGLTLN